MFRTKLTLAGLVVAAAIAPSALAAHDSWYRYATSLTQAQQSVPFITDTLAPGGATSVGGRDPWYGYAVSLTQAQYAESTKGAAMSHADGGGLAPDTAPVESYSFITDTLAPGGGPSVLPAPVSSGFDWGDFGIGAGAMAGVGVLLLGSARLLQRRNVLAV
jgi:hypothetical protein